MEAANGWFNVNVVPATIPIRSSFSMLACSIPGAIKTNMDSSRRSSVSVICAGGILKIDLGLWCNGFAAKLGNGLVIEAELWVICHGLRSAWNAGFKYLEECRCTFRHNNLEQNYVADRLASLAYVLQPEIHDLSDPHIWSKQGLYSPEGVVLNSAIKCIWGDRQFFIVNWDNIKFLILVGMTHSITN